MPPALPAQVTLLRLRLHRALSGPHLLAFLPAATLAAFWLGGEGALTAVALGVPLLFALGGCLGANRFGGTGASALTDSFQPLPPRRLDQLIEDRLQQASARRARVALFWLEIDGYDALVQRHGRPSAHALARRLADRLGATLRPGDLVISPEEGRLAVLPLPVPRLSLDGAMAIAARLQAAAEEPMLIESMTLYPSCSVGLTLARDTPDETATRLRHAAEHALSRARRDGPGGLRAEGPSVEVMPDRGAAPETPQALPAGNEGAGTAAGDAPTTGKVVLPGPDVSHAPVQRPSPAGPITRAEVERALDQGQIAPWFQPQLCTDTGEITGFEALARWAHPVRGLIPPAEFLPLLAAPDLQERLGHAMLDGALTALRAWDRQGLDVAQVAINLTEVELRDPQFPQRLGWELDRCELTPPRLILEVPEHLLSGGLEPPQTGGVTAPTRQDGTGGDAKGRSEAGAGSNGGDGLEAPRNNAPAKGKGAQGPGAGTAGKPGRGEEDPTASQNRARGTGPDEATARGIRALVAMGCQVDLDDFGTGSASAATLRRCGIARLKIDRSFVAKVDRDPDQQRLLNALLTMAERLDLPTVGEGVESAGEHAMLAQLGCSHVQGFGVARPMPLEQTFEWIAAHRMSLQSTPKIGRTAG